MRKGRSIRKTKEVDIHVEVDLDGGEISIDTPSGFFNHMLESFAFHSGIGLILKAEGDTHVDLHHTVEDTGIALGDALKDAIGDGKIKRFGFAIVPMDDALVLFSMDISGRSYLSFEPHLERSVGDFQGDLVEEFFYGLSRSLGATIHIKVLSGRNLHHIIEAIFKAFALSFRMAKEKSEKVESTKGKI